MQRPVVRDNIRKTQFGFQCQNGCMEVEQEAQLQPGNSASASTSI